MTERHKKPPLAHGVRAVIFPEDFPDADRQITLLALSSSDAAWAMAVLDKCMIVTDEEARDLTVQIDWLYLATRTVPTILLKRGQPV